MFASLVVLVICLMGAVPEPLTAFVCAGDAGYPAESLALKRFAATTGLSSRPVTGTYEALVVFARFADDPPQTVPSWADDLFRPDLPGSVAHYYEVQSFGRLRLRGTVLPQVYEVTFPRQTYLAQDATTRGGVSRFVREVLERVDSDIDFQHFDGNKDGAVDLIVVLVVGEAIPNFIQGLATGNGRLGWDRSWRTTDGVEILSSSGVVAVVRSFPHAVGSIAHELGHWLRLPDLYDLDVVEGVVGEAGAGRRQPDPAEDSAGIGVWGLMGWGALGWDGMGIQGPTPLGAWERERLGWTGPPGAEDIKEVVIPQSGVRLTPVASGGGLLKVRVSLSEYFLLEMRDRITGYYERGCPGRGVVIWHVDEMGSQQDERRKWVDVECADGRYQDDGYPVGREPDPATGGDNLDFWAHDDGYRQAHAGNRGDATDLYDGVRFTAFTPTTNPSTQRNDGVSSGLAITNIHLDPAGASFDIDWEGPPVVNVGRLWLTDATHDSLFEPGEEGRMALLLRNGGQAPVGLVVVQVAFDSPVVVPHDTTVTCLLRWVGDTTVVVIPLRVALSVTPGTSVTSTIVITPEQGETQTYRVPVPLAVPDLQMVGVTILDGGQGEAGWGNGDGVLNPGEIVGFDLRVRSRTGWQPWPFLRARLRFPDLLRSARHCWPPIPTPGTPMSGFPTSWHVMQR